MILSSPIDKLMASSTEREFLVGDMTKQPGGPFLVLESYSLDTSRAEGATLAEAVEAPIQLPIRITLRGRGFTIGAVDPKIRIGNVELKDFEIMSDESTIIGYLHELPEEGAVISIDYGRGIKAELPEVFSLSKLSGGDEVS
jgi:hypothetical protein